MWLYDLWGTPRHPVSEKAYDSSSHLQSKAGAVVAFLTPCRSSAMLLEKALGQTPGRTSQVMRVHDNKPGRSKSALGKN